MMEFTLSKGVGQRPSHPLKHSFYGEKIGQWLEIRSPTQTQVLDDCSNTHLESPRESGLLFQDQG
jgi:hypothetical protein